MRGDDLKTRYVLTYYIVTSLLAALAAIIVLKLLFYNPCTPTDPHGSVCTVDCWSIAGLAATVLGVAAAILAILGVFAVAYWWAELYKRVDKQVKTLFEELKTDLNKEIETVLNAQKILISQSTKHFLNEHK